MDYLSIEYFCEFCENLYEGFEIKEPFDYLPCSMEAEMIDISGERGQAPSDFVLH